MYVYIYTYYSTHVFQSLGYNIYAIQHAIFWDF